MDNLLYLDHNATMPIRKEAVEAMMAACSKPGNASSVHRQGQASRRLVDEAREAVARLVGARLVGDREARVIFTSSGTEANNQALRCCGRDRVLVSAVEHSSILNAVPGAEIIPVDENGVVDLDALTTLLAAKDAPAVVSVMLANNETGVIQPVSEVAHVAKEFGALVHCDAAQAAGKVPVHMGDLGVHMISLSAHKIGGPLGAGALVVSADVPLEGLLRGGGQEHGLRSGTENVPAIAGFAVAADLAGKELTDYARLQNLRDDLERRIERLAPAATVFGAGVARLSNTSCITMPGVGRQTQVMALDLVGIAVSAGSACSSGNVGTSRVLRAMGVTGAEDAIRVSLGSGTGKADIDRFLDAWGALYAKAGYTQSNHDKANHDKAGEGETALSPAA